MYVNTCLGNSQTSEYLIPCSLADFELINAGNNVGGLFNVACGHCKR